MIPPRTRGGNIPSLVFLNYTVSTKFSTELLNLVLNLVLLVNLAFETGYRDLLLVCYPWSVLNLVAGTSYNLFQKSAFASFMMGILPGINLCTRVSEVHDFLTKFAYKSNLYGELHSKQPDFQTLGGSFCVQNVYVLDFLARAADNSEPFAWCTHSCRSTAPLKVRQLSWTRQ